MRCLTWVGGGPAGATRVKARGGRRGGMAVNGRRGEGGRSCFPRVCLSSFFSALDARLLQLLSLFLPIALFQLLSRKSKITWLTRVRTPLPLPSPSLRLPKDGQIHLISIPLNPTSCSRPHPSSAVSRARAPATPSTASSRPRAPSAERDRTPTRNRTALLRWFDGRAVKSQCKRRREEKGLREKKSQREARRDAREAERGLEGGPR